MTNLNKQIQKRVPSDKNITTYCRFLRRFCLPLIYC